MMQEQALQGKVALITGGSMGIGKAVAWRMAAAGASVVLGDHQSVPLDATVAELHRAGYTVAGYAADVRVASEMRALVDLSVATYGGIDILVNSAGVQRYGTVVETDEALWDEVIDTNLKGVFLTCKYTIPIMRQRGGGAIVNVSSVQAFASQTGVAAYTASKGAINALTRAMALDHALEGIRVNVVCPASIDTPMLRWAADRFKGDKTREQVLADWGQMHPLGRVGTVEEVAELIAFLAGPHAGFITGAAYTIDGGMLAALGVQLPE